MNRKCQTQLVCLFALLHLVQKKKKRKRRYWVRNIFLKRRDQGAFHNLIQEMRLTDTEKYFNYLRLNSEQFEHLLTLVGPHIKRLHISREPISAGERLAVTLRYLASGDSMVSISYAFRLGKITVSNIINETCQVLWEVLKNNVFPSDTAQDWRKIANNFELMWQLPHCIGAVDVKHIIIQAPPKAGSAYYNYKGSHSIVLMALCDAEYKFIAVDIGAQGRQSDGGVFRQSAIGRRLLNNELHLPEASHVEIGGIPIPYYAVADSAFPLNNNLMRPYAGTYLPQYKRIFNYRLSRGRRVSENSFGILAARWRILRKPIIASLNTVDKIVGAVVVLHNWIMSDKKWDKYCPTIFVDHEDVDGNVINGEWRLEPELANLNRVNRTGSNTYKKMAEEIRENLAFYFYMDRAVPFQWDK